MGMMKASGAIVIGLLGATSVMAADVRPAVVNLPAATTVSANTVIDSSGRAGFKRSRKSSDVAPAVIPIAIIAVAAAAGGVVAATSHKHTSSAGNPTVSPS